MARRAHHRARSGPPTERARVVGTRFVAGRLLATRRGIKTIGARLVAEDADASAALQDVRCPRRPSARALQALVSPVQAAGALLRGARQCAARASS